MVLKLYYDLLSQPSRALYVLLKHVKYPFESVPVALRKREQYSESFTKLNRFNKVPIIEHDGFILTESVAIVQYLAREKIVPDSLYPSDSKNRAKVDQFLEWHHIGLRLNLMVYFSMRFLEPQMTGKQPDPKKVLEAQKRMEATLNDFENKWLGDSNKYLIGDKPTVADLFGICEIEQPRMIGYDAQDKYPRIEAWMQRVREDFNPSYDEAHAILNKVAKKYESEHGKRVSKL